MMRKFFILNLCSDRRHYIDQHLASVIKRMIERIGARWGLNLTDFIVLGGIVGFQFDQLDCAYDIIENIVDEIGVRPAVTVMGESAGMRRGAV